jgi:hypothetical protein
VFRASATSRSTPQPKPHDFSKTHQLSNLLRLVCDTAALQLNRMKTIPSKPTLAVAIAALCWFGNAHSQTPTVQPTVVYVADFELDAANIKTDPAAPPAPPKAPGLLGKVLPPPPGAKKDPQELARELVDSMSTAIIKDLTKAGLTARRLPSGEPLPTAGWLVHGEFTNVHQGNQLERTVIGLGKGKTDVQVLVDIQDLSQGAPTQFHSVTNTVGASSSKLPGAAPMMEHHPAAVAARFVMAGNDLNKNVKQTAAKIAEEVAERTGLAD